jgi:hypothetical protein
MGGVAGVAGVAADDAYGADARLDFRLAARRAWVAEAEAAYRVAPRYARVCSLMLTYARVYVCCVCCIAQLLPFTYTYATLRMHSSYVHVCYVCCIAQLLSVLLQQCKYGHRY